MRLPPTPFALPQHLSGLAEWSMPTAGMFLWLRLLTVEGAGRAGAAAAVCCMHPRLYFG